MQAAADDLTARAADHAHEADAAVRSQVLLVAALTIASLGIAALVARSVTRPTRRLAGAATEIQRGRFALDALTIEGPRELADTARAFNEMSSTLAAVERHAVALADDLDDPSLRESLPGPTGRALQVALNRLRASMQLAETRRVQLQQAATHDALTGLLNRGAALDAIRRDLLRSARGAGTLAVLFLDLDGLKQLNDEHGHSAGDDALRSTADAILEVTRAGDVVGRLGGDELLVASLLDGSRDAHEAAEDLAQRVRASVAARAVSVAGDGPPVPLRCSIGLTLGTSADTVQTVVDRADHALLRAKRAGKDRILWAPPAPGSADAGQSP